MRLDAFAFALVSAFEGQGGEGHSAGSEPQVDGLGSRSCSRSYLTPSQSQPQ